MPAAGAGTTLAAARGTTAETPTMSAGSTLDPDAGSIPPIRPPGHDAGSLGPSDLSDTGSDSLGPTGLGPATLAEDSDAAGTGVDPSHGDVDDGRVADVGFDRIVGASEAGLGGGLDPAEEAWAGTTDEAIDPRDEAGAALAPLGADDDPDDAEAIDGPGVPDGPSGLAADELPVPAQPADGDDPASGDPDAASDPDPDDRGRSRERTAPVDERLARSPVAPTDAFATDPDARVDGGHRDVPVFDRATGGR